MEGLDEAESTAVPPDVLFCKRKKVYFYIFFYINGIRTSFEDLH